MLTVGTHKNEVTKGASWDWPGTGLGKSQGSFRSQKLPFRSQKECGMTCHRTVAIRVAVLFTPYIVRYGTSYLSKNYLEENSDAISFQNHLCIFVDAFSGTTAPVGRVHNVSPRYRTRTYLPTMYT